jgi:hypothetical protein
MRIAGRDHGMQAGCISHGGSGRYLLDDACAGAAYPGL